MQQSSPSLSPLTIPSSTDEEEDTSDSDIEVMVDLQDSTDSSLSTTNATFKNKLRELADHFRDYALTSIQCVILSLIIWLGDCILIQAPRKQRHYGFVRASRHAVAYICALDVDATVCIIKESLTPGMVRVIQLMSRGHQVTEDDIRNIGGDPEDEHQGIYGSLLTTLAFAGLHIGSGSSAIAIPNAAQQETGLKRRIDEHTNPEFRERAKLRDTIHYTFWREHKAVPHFVVLAVFKQMVPKALVLLTESIMMLLLSTLENEPGVTLPTGPHWLSGSPPAWRRLNDTWPMNAMPEHFTLLDSSPEASNRQRDESKKRNDTMKGNLLRKCVLKYEIERNLWPHGTSAKHTPSCHNLNGH
ncbi:uncharacterized protein BDZ99DRAFT_547069 [Mytilinidion resinicola]|uniref:Uncharacterized protein n=1 Tax=Mytilinidion resinicola TaxID=574789 RepID=A0A6A6Y610_9PEZI|nr:uncharacterized protein BDZ99DRAFT_547069 [Mytilinidion resinicola]KAF2803227.1 hypothetical protein BDZ99DRAFT_547069 [Mytilinidion resinicola]